MDKYAFPGTVSHHQRQLVFQGHVYHTILGRGTTQSVCHKEAHYTAFVLQCFGSSSVLLCGLVWPVGHPREQKLSNTPQE